MSNLYTHQWNPFTPTPPRPLTPGTAGYGAATWTDYAPPAAWAGAGFGQISVPNFLCGVALVGGLAWIWGSMVTARTTRERRGRR